MYTNKAEINQLIEEENKVQKKRMMSRPVLMLQCLLTGFSVRILSKSSEKSMAKMRRYVWAILIISSIWAIVAYASTERYFKWPWWASLLAAVFAVILVVNIEKLIIHAHSRLTAFAFRFVIGIVMALIGSILIDQILFADDIDLAKVGLVNERVNNLLPQKTAELNESINRVKQDLENLRLEWEKVTAELRKRPTIMIVEYANNAVKRTRVANPLFETENSLREQMNILDNDLRQKSNLLMNVKFVLENELRGKVGFFDDLEVMKGIILRSWVSLGAWLIFFIFLLALELLVVFNKLGDEATDYENRIEYEDSVRNRRLAFLKQSVETA